jgi:amino acid adenylation domain-containing protein
MSASVVTLEAGALEKGRVVEAADPGVAARSVVGCGRPVGDTIVRIVNPITQEVCPPDHVGEVWVAGRSVASGYWNKTEENARMFGAHLRRTDEGPFLRTGDLGFVRGGELFIAGRIKDLIIVQGRNLYPHDLEFTIEQCHPLLRSGGSAAFAVDRGDAEDVVVVQEVERRIKEAEAEAICGLIRQRVADEHEVHVSEIVLIKSGGLPKTSSGKVRRGACREAYLADLLPVVARNRMRQAASESITAEVDLVALEASAPEQRAALIGDHLQRFTATLLAVTPSSVPIDQPISMLGLDSLTVVQLRHHIEQSYGRVVPSSFLLEGGTLRELAGILAGDVGQPVEDEWRDEPGPQRSIETSDCHKGPLTFAQERVWFHQQMNQGRSLYNVSVGLRLSGSVDVGLLEQSLRAVISRHDSLRSGFREEEGAPHQVVAPSLSWSLRVVDLEDQPQPAREGLWRRAAQEDASAPFDLATPPLMRGTIFRLSQREHVLQLTMHHLVVDGWSVAVLLRDFGIFYEAASAGTVAHLDPLPFGATDVARWEHDGARGDAYKASLAYWRAQLADAPGRLEFPADYCRAPGGRGQAAVCSRVLSPGTVDKIGVLGRQRGFTRFTILMAGIVGILARYTGQTDIVVGCTAANRERAQTTALIGMFTNLLALRVDLSDDPSILDLLDRMRTVMLNASAHQRVPFDRVLDAARLKRAGAHIPLISLLVSQEPRVAVPSRLGEATCSREDMQASTPLVDMTLFVREEDHRTTVTAEYDAGLFREDTVARFLEHLEIFASEMMNDPERQASAIPLMTDEERHRIIHQWNETTVHAAPCDFRMVQEWATRTPAAAAVWSEGQTTPYSELNRRADCVAAQLRDLNLPPNPIVGLCVERRPEMVIGLLGIWKAGGAFLPVDPALPGRRRAFILGDAGASALVLQSDLTALAEEFRGPRIVLPSASEMRDEARPADHTVDIAPDHLAYVLYTSGSTGQPKGVMMPQRGLSNLISWQVARSAERPVRRTLQFAAMSFDVAMQEILATLCAGGTLYIAPDAVRTSAASLLSFIREHEIERLFLPPVALAHLATAAVEETRALPSMREVICAGEQLVLTPAVRDFLRLCPNGCLENQYGPTETHVATAWRVEDPAALGPVPIGRPIQETPVYVLDVHQRPVPVGAVGELYIGGAGVAHGYINRPDLTAECFVPDPFCPGGRVYRTGDLVRYRPNGVLEFRGSAGSAGQGPGPSHRARGNRGDDRDVSGRAGGGSHGSRGFAR